MSSCKVLIDEVCELAALLSNQLEEEATNAQGKAKQGIASGLRIVQTYLGNLNSAISKNSQEEILRAVNAFTGVSKGLSEQGWISPGSVARETAWNVTKSAIRASDCLREG